MTTTRPTMTTARTSDQRWVIRKDTAGGYVLARLVDGCYYDIGRFEKEFYARRCADELTRAGVE